MQTPVFPLAGCRIVVLSIARPAYSLIRGLAAANLRSTLRRCTRSTPVAPHVDWQQIASIASRAQVDTERELVDT